MDCVPILNKRSRPSHLAIWVVVTGLAAFPVTAAAQEYHPDDTTGYYEDEYYEDQYYEDEYYEGEYYEDEYYEGEYYEDEYSDEYYYEEDYGEEGYYDEGEYYEDDAYNDQEGFDETFDDAYLEEVGPVEGEEDLELVDDQAGEVELQEIEKPKIRKPRVIRGYTAKVSVASPWLVGLGFDSFWYSYIDARVTLDLPRKAGAGALAPAYSFEVGTFSFDNMHPSGGQFGGVSLQALMRIPLGPLEAATGGGLYVSGGNMKGGGIFGISYTLNLLRFLALTVESRLSYVHDATPTGDAAFWMDVGGSFGFRF
ncbi:MAG: hypothetical protein JSU61_05600 [Fidelibacterota bacterium]|nr:MAG: hypothetical protein JSU61_05600 [Candidatus Neomarinimicrobiota bacterium]